MKRSGGPLLLCFLLWTGSSLATGPEHSAAPPTSCCQATAPSCETPSYEPPLSTPPLTWLPKDPPTGCYDLRDGSESECLKTQMGVQYVVTVNKNMLYFNIYPSSTRVTGQCGQNTSSLFLKFTGGHVEFTFHKEKHMSYVTAVRASLQASICSGCQEELFKGIKSNMTLFKVQPGLCYKCDTQTTLPLAENLSLRIMHARIQAFGISDNTFGLEEECWPDYYRRAVPNVLGGVTIGICLIAILTYLLIHDNHQQGYERI